MPGIRPLRLLIVSREYPPFVGGGIGAYAVRWARLLAERAGASGDAGSSAATGWGAPVVVTTGPEGRVVEAVEDGITVVRLPLVAGVAPRSAGGKRGGSALLHRSPPGRWGSPDWSRPHPAIATPEVEAAFRTFHPTAVFAMQVARALPGLVARHGIGAIEGPDTGAPLWFALNQRRVGGKRLENREQREEGRAALPPVITHLHSPTEWIEAINGAESGRPVDELRRMEADVVRWSDGLVAPSRGMAEWAARHWGIERGRISVIPYPIGELAAGAAPPAPAPPGPDGGPGGELRVLFVGRLERRKGVDTLLAGFAEAARQARERGGEFAVRLDLAGRDTEDPATGEMFGRAHFERLIPPDLRAQVTLHGELAPAEVRRLMAHAHAAVVPSPLDNFPNTCMEAMSAGRPVLAAAAGGALEMLEGGGGLLFAPGDARELAARLLELAQMGTEARAQMGQAARERILSMCDDDAVLQARLEHVHGVLEERSGAAGRLQACPTRPSADERPPSVRPCAIVNRSGATDDEVAPLAAAVEAGGVRYAHGWVRDVRAGRSVIDVFGTPSEGSLFWVEGPLESVGPVGPIAVEAALAEKLGLGESSDGLAALRALVAAAPGEGAVVPAAVIATPAARAQPRAPFGEPDSLTRRVRRIVRKLRGSAPT